MGFERTDESPAVPIGFIGRVSVLISPASSTRESPRASRERGLLLACKLVRLVPQTLTVVPNKRRV